MFYMGDDLGHLRELQMRDADGQPNVPKAFEYPFTELVKKALDERVRSASQVFVIHHNGVDAYSNLAEPLALQLAEYGFVRASEEGRLAVSPLHQRFHPQTEGADGPLDRFRIVVSRFTREDVEASN
jgi:hypothetical protein